MIGDAHIKGFICEFNFKPRQNKCCFTAKKLPNNSDGVESSEVTSERNARLCWLSQYLHISR